MRLRWALIALCGFGVLHLWNTREITRPPGQTAAGEPRQEAIAGNPPHFEKNGYDIVALARFDMGARVLGVEHYHFGRAAKLAPIDVAFGWGAMSDSAVLSKISISQGQRFYYWHVAEFPVAREVIETHSANMHLIPANAEVESSLADLRVGSIVALSGYLVETRAADGWHWRSSLTRGDTGAGACELIWVERLEVR